MTNAHRCDNCGEYNEGEPEYGASLILNGPDYSPEDLPEVVTYNPDYEEGDVYIDICERCIGELLKSINDAHSD